MPGGPELKAEELLLRRFQFEQYADGDEMPNINAFNPTKRDTAGLSLFRENYTTASELGAKGSAGKKFWVARLQVRVVRNLGADLVPDVAPEGHVTVSNLRYDNRRSREAKTLKERLRRDCIEVVGPFEGTVQRR